MVTVDSFDFVHSTSFAIEWLDKKLPESYVCIENNNSPIATAVLTATTPGVE